LQKEHCSGKKKTHTDKNILVVNEIMGKVVSLGPTVVGKMHDKKSADAAQITYPTNATLDKDTGRVMEIACGLHNLRVSSRHPHPVFDLLSLVNSG